MAPIEFLDPTHENNSATFRLNTRAAALDGATVALLSNGKKGTIPFFDALADSLRDDYGVAEVVRITKSNYSTPVEADLLGDAERWNALIAGIGD